MATKKDKEILRELAKRHMDLSAKEANNERERRIRRINGLVAQRPIVWIDEIPWHEMDIDGSLKPICEDEDAREMETYFRRVAFRWRHIQADMLVDDEYYVFKSFGSTGNSMEVKEKTITTDKKNHIISHNYEDQLDTEEKVDALRIPVVTANPSIDQKNLELAEDILDGIMPVRLKGHGIYYAPWDDISRYRGVEPVLIDMMERPEFIHKIIAKFTEIGVSYYEQMESLGLLDHNIQSLHCTPPQTDDLPAPDYNGGESRFKDMWFRGMAQMFSTVSPSMHEEFDLNYMRPLMDRCGLSYYGCCESLDNKLDLLKKIPNMRKLGVSPWSDVRVCAEQMGDQYVFARKPNPAFVAGTFDADTVKAEISATIEACIANNCPYEFVLKDISTVSYRPQNLIDWTETVMETIDEYYK